MYLRHTPEGNVTKIMYSDDNEVVRIENQNVDEKYNAIIDSKKYILNINKLSITLRK